MRIRLPYYGARLPLTLGHENAGQVEAVGSGVEDVKPGDAVAVYGAWGFGVCALLDEDQGVAGRPL